VRLEVGGVGMTLAAAAFLLLSPSTARAQTVRGLLVDEITGEPIALGMVTLVTEGRDSVTATLTTEEGFYFLPANGPGNYALIVEAFGYWSTIIGPFTLGENTDRILEARVAVLPLPIEGVTVEADVYEPRVHHLVSNGFYERMGQGRGEFITPGEIAMSGATYPQQLFYTKKLTRVFQTQTVQPRNLRDNFARVEGRATTFGPWGDLVTIRTPKGGYCTPAIYVDRVKMIGEFESLADLAPMSQVTAIEIYQSPFQLPVGLDLMDLQRDPCGALLIWTRG
jgi:carboxypeptidase family protein